MSTMTALGHLVERAEPMGGPTAAPELTRAEIARDGAGALSPAFWARFHEHYWEREAVVLRQPLARPLATAAEAFAALSHAGDGYRAGTRSAGLEFCIEHANLLADVGLHLPGAGDASIGTYAARVTRMLQGQRFGLVVDELQGDDPELWLRLRELLRGLYAVTGVPGEQAKAGMFLGNYETTPFGVHRGRAGVLMFVVSGRKRILAWPDAYFHGKEDLTYRLDYGPYVKDAIVLEGEPGDILYWPSDHWHIGEDVDGGVSMAISLTLFMEPSVAPDLLKEVRRLLEARMAPAHRAAAAALRPGRRPSTRGLTTSATRAVRALRRVTADPRVERALVASRLNHVTGYAFATVPEPLDAAPLADDDVVRGHREHPVLWVERGDELVCSASGRAFVHDAHPDAIRLLRWVNSGRRRRVSRLLAAHASPDGPGALTPADVRRLLDKLRSLRALEMVRRQA